MADTVDDIKGRLSITDVVSQYVQLKKAGRNFKGLCPFHSEKTPSFVVSPEKQICHCFGCNKGGDIFTFIEEVEGVNFAEALQILADKAGVKIDTAKLKNKVGKSEKDEYFKAHDLACSFFEKNLYGSKDGKKVLAYLKKRGLTKDSIEEFRIGFALDDYEALHKYLLKKGISKKVLIKSGFVSSKSVTSDQVYDKFRSRLMFPIFDYLGRICGFGGRALKKDQMPKYLNSPENVIYNKSKVLYGLSHSKKFIKEEDKVVFVEGYFDVIMPYQAGIKNVVATSGTALTQDQARLVKRFTANAVTCFDTDKAGFEATKRGYVVLQNEEISVKTVNQLKEKDPADFVLENGDAFKKIVDESVDFITFFTDKLLEENDIGTLDGRRFVLKELMPFYKQMSSSTRDYYIRELSKKLNISETSLYDDVENFKLPVNHPAKLSPEAPTDSKKISLSELICAFFLEHPFLFEKFSKTIDDSNLDEDMKAVYNALTDQYNTIRTEFESWNFDKGFLAEIKDKINVWTLYVEERYSMFGEESLELELGKLVDKLQKTRKIGRLKKVQNDIAEAEKAEDKEKLIELLQEQQKLLADDLPENN